MLQPSDAGWGYQWQPPDLYSQNSPRGHQGHVVWTSSSSNHMSSKFSPAACERDMSELGRKQTGLYIVKYKLAYLPLKQWYSSVSNTVLIIHIVVWIIT